MMAAKTEGPHPVVVEEEILRAIQASQEATLTIARTWADTMAAVMPKLTEPRPPVGVEGVTAFIERLTEVHAAFLTNLFGVVLDMGKVLPEVVSVK